MREVEAKILDIDVKTTIKKLKQLGFRKVYDGKIYTIHFERQNGATLRIRTIANKHYITVKRSVHYKNVKDANEMEFEILEPKIAQSALLALGFKVKQVIIKHRISYSREDIRCEFDTHPNIPTFLEIESTSPRKVLTFAKKINIPKSRLTSMPFHKIEKLYEKGK